MCRLTLFFYFAAVCTLLCFSNPIYSKITEVVCDGTQSSQWCSSDTSTITIEGDDFKVDSQAAVYTLNAEKGINIVKQSTPFTSTKLQGKLQYNTEEVAEGPYLIQIPSAAHSGVFYEGTIVVGNLFGLEPLEPYVPKPLPTNVYILNQEFDNITSSFNFTLNGAFDESSKYAIMFYSDNNLNDFPQCERVHVTKETLQCTVSYAPRGLKSFRFLVEDITQNVYIPVKNVQKTIDIVNDSPSCHQVKPTHPPASLPYVESATGDCVLDSSKCVDGAVLMFTGYEFKEDPTANRVNVEKLNNTYCKVTESSLTNIKCTLSGIEANMEGSYTLTLQQKQSDGSWSEVKTRMGTLVLGAQSGNAGWTIFYVKPSKQPTPEQKSTSSHLRTVTTALTIVFAILFGLALASLLFMSYKYKMIPRKVWSSITSQLSASSNNNINGNHQNDNYAGTDANEPVRTG